MNVMTSEYPELSEWFQSPKEVINGEWTSVSVSVPAVQQPDNVHRVPAVQQSDKIHHEHARLQPVNHGDPLPVNMQTSIPAQITTRQVVHLTAESVIKSERVETEEVVHVSPAKSHYRVEGGDMEVFVDTVEAEDINQSLKTYREQFGCMWGCSGGTNGIGCHETCPFVRTVLGLDELEHRIAYTPTPQPQHNIQKVTIVRQTPEGFVKVETDALFNGQPIQFTQLPYSARQFTKNPTEIGTGSYPSVYLAPVSSSVFSNATLKSQPIQLESRPMVTGLILSSNQNNKFSTANMNQATKTSHILVPTTTVSMNYSNTTTQAHVNTSQNMNSFIKQSIGSNMQQSTTINYTSANSPVSIGDEIPHLAHPIPSPSISMPTSSPSLPTPSPSPPAEGADFGSLMTSSSTAVADTSSTAASLFTCTICGTRRPDMKSLVKHKRNTHQIYYCKECGEANTGYYQMATHTKKMHQKEPAFFCECGRNFSEKKGITKHQNTCTFIKK